jgi:uncharacterized protein YbjT (DUF2867 family)
VGNPAVRGRVIELGGPEPVTYNTVTGLFEAALGRSVNRQYVPEAALAQQLATAEDPLQKTLAGLALCAARGDAIDSGPALQMAWIPLTPVRDFVEGVVRL